MRTQLLAAAATLTLAMAAPAFAQTSTSASNISPADTHSDIAPRLPDPSVGAGAGPADYLQAAQNALSRHRSGEAQEALERAETRLLDRSTVPDAAGTPDTGPTVSLIAQARDAIGRKDWHAANDSIAQALKNAGAMASSQPPG